MPQSLCSRSRGYASLTYNYSMHVYKPQCLVLESSPDGTFEDNLEKVLRTIRLRLGQEQLDGVETLPEMPSLERTISSYVKNFRRSYGNE